MTAKHDMGLCEKCGVEFPQDFPRNKPRKFRFCRGCRSNLMQDMRENGYLVRKEVGHIGTYRSVEQRENTFDTKNGRD